MKQTIIILILITTLPFPAAASPIPATDFRGKTLSFSQPPERIVCLIESALS